jgi:hypothetical protein
MNRRTGWAVVARLALAGLVLVLAGSARADDDDTLDTRRLGEPIPERLQQLEREWAEDVGTKEAPEEPAEPDAEPVTPFAEEPDVEMKSPLPDEPPAAKRPSALGPSVGSADRSGKKAPKGSPSTAQPKPNGLPNAAERRAAEVKNPEE